MSVSTHGLRVRTRSPCGSRGGGAAVVDALRDLAADGHLHRLGDRHRAQAARAVQQLRQPVRAVLGRRCSAPRVSTRLQRLVVPADPGVPGHLHHAVHRAQHAEDHRRPEDLQGRHARAEPARVRHNGPRPRSTSSRTPRRNRIGQLLAGGGWKVKLQHRDGDGRMVAARGGRRQQARLHRRALARSCWSASAACSTAT